MIKEVPQEIDPRLSDALEEFIDSGFPKRRAPSTCDTYRRKLLGLLGDQMDGPLSALTFELVWGRCLAFSRGSCESNANSYIRTCKAFLRWAHLHRNYLVGFDPDRLKVLPTPKRLPRVLREDEIARLLRSVPQKHFSGLRDYTMLVVMLGTGIRVSELTGMTLDDVYIAPSETATMGSAIRVVGKGNKQRQIKLCPEAKAALKHYLRPRERAIAKAGKRTAWLFPNVHGGKMSPHTVQDRLRLHGDRIGIKLHPHMLRATFATLLSRNGARLQTIQQALGHTTLTMAKHYTQVEDADAFDETERLNPLAGLLTTRGSRLTEQPVPTTLST